MHCKPERLHIDTSGAECLSDWPPSTLQNPKKNTKNHKKNPHHSSADHRSVMFARENDPGEKSLANGDARFWCAQLLCVCVRARVTRH